MTAQQSVHFQRLTAAVYVAVRKCLDYKYLTMARSFAQAPAEIVRWGIQGESKSNQDSKLAESSTAWIQVRFGSPCHRES